MNPRRYLIPLYIFGSVTVSVCVFVCLSYCALKCTVNCEQDTNDIGHFVQIRILLFRLFQINSVFNPFEL